MAERTSAARAAALAKAAQATRDAAARRAAALPGRGAGPPESEVDAARRRIDEAMKRRAAGLPGGDPFGADRPRAAPRRRRLRPGEGMMIAPPGFHSGRSLDLGALGAAAAAGKQMLQTVRILGENLGQLARLTAENQQENARLAHALMRQGGNLAKLEVGNRSLLQNS
jgi:hypothetical protein